MGGQLIVEFLTYWQWFALHMCFVFVCGWYFVGSYLRLLAAAANQPPELVP